MKQKLLLLEDVDGLGRSGDLVTAKPGYIRNFLLPQKKALVANKQALKMQASLQKAREEKASVDREEALKLSAQLATCVISTEVKVDPEGHMYGSVTSLDIARLMQDKGYSIERRHVVLPQPIKAVGSYPITLKLDEGVPGVITLEIIAEKITS